jgi:hypothetical protein
MTPKPEPFVKLHPLFLLIAAVVAFAFVPLGCVMSPAGAGGLGTRSAGNLQLNIKQESAARDGHVKGTDPATGQEVEATGAVVVFIMGNSAQLEAGKATDLGASSGVQLNSPNGQQTTTLTAHELRAAERLKQMQTDADAKAKAEAEAKDRDKDAGADLPPPDTGSGKADNADTTPPVEGETPPAGDNQTGDTTIMRHEQLGVTELTSDKIYAKSIYTGGDPANGDLGTTRAIAYGTPGTGVTAVEHSVDGVNYLSILTLDEVALTIGDNAALSGGALIYTFPAGSIVVRGVRRSLAMTLTTGTPKTDTPELGLGTTQGTGANATLGAVAATAEDVSGPQAMADINGTVAVLTDALNKVIESAGAHTVYLNHADTYADVDDTAATVSGTIAIQWSKLPLA